MSLHHQNQQGTLWAESVLLLKWGSECSSVPTSIHRQGHRSHRHSWSSCGKSRQSRPFSSGWPPTVRPYRSTLGMVYHNPGQWCTLLRWCSHQRIPPCSYEGDCLGTVHLWNERQFTAAVTFSYSMRVHIHLQACSPWQMGIVAINATSFDNNYYVCLCIIILIMS